MIKWILPLSIILCGIGVIILGIQLKDYTYPSQIQKEIIKEFNKEWERIKMTKRFTYVRGDGFTYNGKHINPYEVTDLLNKLSTENRQLKQENEELKESVWSWSKSYNRVYEDNERIRNTIKYAYYNERTQLGKSVLKQLLEAIQ